MSRFEHQTAVITGAANGIGRATARRMAKEGARVVLIDIDRERLQDLTAEIGSHAVPLLADVLSKQDRTHAIDTMMAELGSVDILVNCVGGSTVLEQADLPLTSMTEMQWDRMMQFNLTTAFLCCKGLLPYLKQSSVGAIVNLSSISGRWNTPQSGSAYATTKAGLIGFTRRLSAEIAPLGIRCNAVAPGYVMTQRIRENVWNRVSEEQQKCLLEQIPLRRFAAPDEIAAVITFLASTDSSYITGVTIDCNGGITSV